MIDYRPGRWLLSLVALVTSLGGWFADFGATHMFNDRWPPHAKFHNANTLLLSTLLGLMTLFYTWRRRGIGLDNLRAATAIGLLYWICQLGSICLPNTALTDPEFVGSTRFPFGFTGPQPFIDVVLFAVVGVAYVLESRWMQRNSRAGAQ